MHLGRAVHAAPQPSRCVALPVSTDTNLSYFSLGAGGLWVLRGALALVLGLKLYLVTYRRLLAGHERHEGASR
jgi:hypothetical protein